MNTSKTEKTNAPSNNAELWFCVYPFHTQQAALEWKVQSYTERQYQPTLDSIIDELATECFVGVQKKISDVCSSRRQTTFGSCEDWLMQYIL